MSDAIRYCKNCETNVMCHLERKCMRKALGLSSVDGSAPPPMEEMHKALDELHVTCDCADPRYARFGEAMWKYITNLGGEFCGDEISEDILPLAQAAGLCCRVEYDPAIHGEGIEADPGSEIWYWGNDELWHGETRLRFQVTAYRRCHERLVHPLLNYLTTMKTKLRKSEWLDDWYVIEPHHGTGQPEGTSEEWKVILEAMRKRERESFRRVGVKFDGDGNALFRSPRNSMDDDEAVIPAGEVDSWISYAEGILGMNSN